VEGQAECSKQQGATRRNRFWNSKKSENQTRREFIRPQRQWADVVVSFYPPGDLSDDSNGHLNVRLVLRPTVSHPDFTQILNPAVPIPRQRFALELERDMGKPVVLEVDGHATKEQVRELEKIIIVICPILSSICSLEGRAGKAYWDNRGE